MLRIRKTKQVGKARVSVSKRGVSASTGKRVRVTASKRGVGFSIRLLPGISFRWKL